MLTLEVRARHPVERVREEARQYFTDQVGLDEDESVDAGRMMFSGRGGFVSLEFVEDEREHPNVVLTASEYEYDAREFARAVGA